jgi:hypothetical protein
MFTVYRLQYQLFTGCFSSNTGTIPGTVCLLLSTLVCYETLVKPANEIIDYNTRYVYCLSTTIPVVYRVLFIEYRYNTRYRMFTFYRLWSATRPWSSRTMRLSTTIPGMFTLCRPQYQVRLLFIDYNTGTRYVYFSWNTTPGTVCLLFIDFGRLQDTGQAGQRLSTTIPGMFTFHRIQYQLSYVYFLSTLVCYEILVKPDNEIIDCNTRYVNFSSNRYNTSYHMLTFYQLKYQVC